MVAAHAASSVTALSDAVLRHGPDGQLPAHLSMVLGINRMGQTTPVKQAVIRSVDRVRTFNVCTANHDALVIVTYEERSRTIKAYLLSGSGVLRKAVDYQPGGEPHERALSEAHRDFVRELKFWADYSGQARPQ
jgi:hypothetical protein